MPEIKKVLFLSCSAGLGHVRAAESLHLTCQKSYPSIASLHLDINDCMGWFLRTSLIRSYNTIIRRYPSLYGALYSVSDTVRGKKFFSLAPALLKKNSRPLFEIVNRYQPDRVVATHFIPTYLLLPWPHQFPVDVINTDYTMNRMWFATGVRHIFVATPELKQTSDKIHSSVIVSGLPLHPDFFLEKNTKTLKQKLGITNNLPVILLLSGGFGLTDLSSIAASIMPTKRPLNLVAVAGKNNKHLRHKLETIAAPPHVNYRVLEFANNIDEWMRVADVIITKPGGLTITECLYLKKPILLITPLPGQEKKNAEYVVKKNYGRLITQPKEILATLYSLLDKPEWLTRPPDLPNPNELILKNVLM